MGRIQRFSYFLREMVYAGGMALVLVSAGASAPKISPSVKAQLQDVYGKLPLAFEANHGQSDSEVQFLSRGPGYSLFLTPTGAVLTLSERQAESADRASGANRARPEKQNAQTDAVAPSKGAVLRVRLVGANPRPKSEGLEQLPGKVNYFVGKDPAKWRTGIPTYANVKYRAVYPGVDLVYYGTHRRLEFDFIVAPGANPTAIRLDFQGAAALKVDTHGDLVMHVGAGEIRLPKPFVYQTSNGEKHAVAGGYVVNGVHEVTFELAAYDRAIPLVIDPKLEYATYLGGSGSDLGHSITIDPAGSAYVAGETESANFPTTAGAFDTVYGGGFTDAFVTKMNATGTALVYSTYLGGGGGDVAQSIAVDVFGDVHVTGWTDSTDFPVTVGAFQTVFGGGSRDAFVTKLNSTGTGLLYSTYLGGDGPDTGYGIAVDASANPYVTGAASINFPTTTGAFDPSFNGFADAFVTKLSATGAELVYSTYLGGNTFSELARGIALDSSGNAYITGYTNSTDFPTTAGAFQRIFGGGFWDAFVAKFNPTGSTLIYSSYLGGTSNDLAYGITVDATGFTYVIGETFSANFPTTAGAFQTTFGGVIDAFVTKVSPTGSSLVYSTYLGGVDIDAGRGIALDADGNACLTGGTTSTNFPTTVGAFQTVYGGGSYDAFVTKVNASGAGLVYSTYLGGTEFDAGDGIATDIAGNAYVVGDTNSANFPSTEGSYDTTSNGDDDIFIVKISDVGAPAELTLTPAGATNPVNTEHCVTATVQDTLGRRTPDITVRFNVTGATARTGSVTTNDSGEASFCYSGPTFAGGDTITAYADTDADNTQDADEPSGNAAKTWVLPPTTGGCKVDGDGRIIADNGDKASFEIDTRSRDLKGESEYEDHGPATSLKVKSIEVETMVCSEDRTQASIYGKAKLNRSTTVSYLVEVKDRGKPGRRDSYRIVLSNGYDSGEHNLERGDVDIR